MLLGVTNLPLVLGFMKGNKFCYFHAVKFVNSKDIKFFPQLGDFVFFSNSGFLVISPCKWN